MKKKIISLAILILLIGCTSPEIKKLKKVEIKEYQGEKLGSITDFRENSISGPQYINISKYKLNITGLVENQTEYTYQEVLTKPKYNKVTTIYCVEGWDVTILWEGILLKDIFNDTKIKPEANTVIFYAEDGYTSSLPLDYIIKNDIMIAYKMNDIVLPPEKGYPFQLVAEDKWGYKWVKWIKKIELHDNPHHRGYWEQRGYNNNASIEGSKFKEIK